MLCLGVNREWVDEGELPRERTKIEDAGGPTMCWRRPYNVLAEATPSIRKEVDAEECYSATEVDLLSEERDTDARQQIVGPWVGSVIIPQRWSGCLDSAPSTIKLAMRSTGSEPYAVVLLASYRCPASQSHGSTCGSTTSSDGTIEVGSKDTSCLEVASLYGHEARASKGRGEIAAIALEPPTEGPTGEIVWFVKDVHPHVGAKVDTVAVGGDTPHR
ncbi:hypothetical protein BHM03_00012049 [Ensete ventricosum]|nr:hypothetical protein BHM03_00012049 [Ensete ventricosum]